MYKRRFAGARNPLYYSTARSSYWVCRVTERGGRCCDRLVGWRSQAPHASAKGLHFARPAVHGSSLSRVSLFWTRSLNQKFWFCILLQCSSGGLIFTRKQMWFWERDSCLQIDESVERWYRWKGENTSARKCPRTSSTFQVSSEQSLSSRHTQIEDQLTQRLDVAFQNCTLRVQNWCSGSPQNCVVA